MTEETEPSPAAMPDAAAEVAPLADAPDDAPDDAEREIRRRSRRAFLWGAGIVAAGGLGLRAVNRSPLEEGIPAPLRRMLLFNETVARRLFLSPDRLAPEYPRAYARTPRNNYKGRTPVVDPAAWRLTVGGLADDAPARTLSLADLRGLPRVEQTTELKCVEGWSCIVTWAGVRFRDFAERFPPPPNARYVALVSDPPGMPEERYYIGLDLASCLHPQTILAYEMNGAPLDAAHGAPLRLAIPHKYGIKNIKLITGIAYSAARPADFWAERGYDFHAGL